MTMTFKKERTMEDGANFDSSAAVDVTRLEVIEGGKDVPRSAVVGSKYWANKIRKRAKELAGDLETGYMELAKILYQVYDVPVDGEASNGPIFKAWGYKSFAEYAEEELHLHRRKAERLRGIWYRLEVELAGMNPDLKERIVRIGWSKVRELVRVLTLKNAEEWVKRAEECSYTQLLVAVSKYREEVDKMQQLPKINPEGNEGDSGLGGGNNPVFSDGGGIVGVSDQEPPIPPVEKHVFEHFMLYEEQAEIVRSALQRASEISKSDKKSHNLHLICMDFLATNDFKNSPVEDRMAFLAKFESMLGLKLIAVDPESNDVVYGMSTLENASKEDDDASSVQ